jgi:glycosyltransferase involved in cell wall biosynthesis
MELCQMDRPLVTLYMLSYNRRQYAHEAFESMLQQTYSPLEIIVSDDRSTDGTFEMIQERAHSYKGPHQLRLYQNERNLGFIGNLNRVFGLMRGELLIMNCDDDISLPNKVERIVTAWMKYDKKPTAIATGSILIDPEGKEVGANNVGKERIVRRSLPSFMRLGCPNGMYGRTGAAFAYSKKVVEVFGPITTRFTADDPVMVRRSYVLGPLLILPELLFKYRVGVGLSTQKNVNFRREVIRQRWSFNTLKQLIKDLDHISLDPAMVKKLGAIFAREMEIEFAYSKMWKMGFCGRVKSFCMATKCGLSFFEFPRQTVRLALRAANLL